MRIKSRSFNTARGINDTKNLKNFGFDDLSVGIPENKLARIQ